MDALGAVAEIHKALAHPARLRILDLLARREACVCHLTTVLGLRQPYVSQQLAALRDAGLVVGRRDGTLVYYRLVDDRLAGLLALGRSLAGVPGSVGTPGAAADDGPVAGCPCPPCQSRSSGGAGAGGDDDG